MDTPNILTANDTIRFSSSDFKAYVESQARVEFDRWASSIVADAIKRVDIDFRAADKEIGQ